MEKPKFKEELIGLDFVQSRPDKEKKGLIAEVQIMAVAMQEPKMTYEEILALPMDVFLAYLLEYRTKYKQTYENIANTYKGKIESQESGFQFAKEEDYIKIAEGKGSKEIQFSTVKKEE